MKTLAVLVTFMAHVYGMAETLAIVEKGNNSLKIVDTVAGEMRTIDVGYLPHEVAVTGTHVFVSNYGHNHVRSTSLADSPGNFLSMIHLNSLSVKNIELGSSKCAPHGIEASKNKKFIFVTCEGRQEIVMINAKTGILEKIFRTNQAGSHMLTASSDYLYVANFWIGTVSVIDIVSGEIIQQIRTGRSTEGIGISPDEKTLFVTVVENNEVLKINTQSNKVISRKQLESGSSPIRVMVSNDNNKILVNLAGKGLALIFDANSLDLIKEIPVGNQPIGLSVSRKKNLAYVSNMKDGSISIIDLENNRKIKDLNLDLKLPDGLTVIE